MLTTPGASCRPIYLRLSVTRDCNLRCRYCRPRGRQHVRGATAPVLDDEALCALVRRINAAAPVEKVRLTGGEPLCRPGLPALVRRLRGVLPQATFGLTTNGVLLPGLGRELHRAGIDAINVSCDAADPMRFARATGGGDLSRVLAGLEALTLLRGAGTSGTATPLLVKLNAVLQRTVNGEQVADLVRLAGRHALDEVRFIELMPIGPAATIYPREYLPGASALARLRLELSYDGPLEQRGTARRHRFRLEDGRPVTVGFIEPISAPFCSGCNRVRLDAGGRLHGCLRSEAGVDLVATSVASSPPSMVVDVDARIRAVLEQKCPAATDWPTRAMAAIGG